MHIILILQQNLFNHVRDIDFYIVATQDQKRVLQQQFEKYKNLKPKIYTIPVGNISRLNNEQQRKPYSIITASRLANEKHVDWLIKAVVKAHKVNSDISFDIYGEGSERKKLQQTIDNSHANSYIKLKGHVNLAEVYKQYELYLSGSTSEGFGLTLMEAVGSGLGIIGFDVYYGNTTFINNHINGFKVPIDTVNIDENNLVTELANKILLFFTQNKEKLVDGLIFPSNLYIWCSMNSADQGVLPLDTAFKRRWDFEYFSVDDSFDEELFDTFGKIIVGKGKKVKWNDMRVFLNDKLSNFNVPEDKLMGPFFLSKNILNSDDSEVTKAFKNKVLMYLFEDIGTQYRSKIFNISKLRFSIIRDEFDRIGEKIFNGSDEIQTNIINVDEIDNDQKSSEQDGLGS